MTRDSSVARLDAVEITGIPESFDAAARASGEIVEREFDVAGRRVLLRSAGSRMLDALSRAFGHLAATVPADPELTIHLWDAESNGSPPPPTPDVGDEHAPGAFFYWSDNRFRAGFQLGTSGDARVLDVYPEAPTPALSVLDNDSHEAWYWVADAERIPYWEEATPFRFILDWWLRDLGVHPLHAAAIGTPEGGVLLAGRSGSGKSTAALSALSSELLYAGDDYVAVALEPRPWVYSLYSSGKLMPDHVMRLPFLLPALSNSEQLGAEKAVVFVNEHWPANVSAGFPLRAILASRVVLGRQEAWIGQTSPLAGLAALAPSTVFQMHTRGQDSLARMRRLAETVPSYVLEHGFDMASTPRAVSEFLARLNGKA